MIESLIDLSLMSTSIIVRFQSCFSQAFFWTILLSGGAGAVAATALGGLAAFLDLAGYSGLQLAIPKPSPAC